MMRNEPFKRIV